MIRDKPSISSSLFFVPATLTPRGWSPITPSVEPRTRRAGPLVSHLAKAALSQVAGADQLAFAAKLGTLLASNIICWGQSRKMAGDS